MTPIQPSVDTLSVLIMDDHLMFLNPAQMLLGQCQPVRLIGAGMLTLQVLEHLRELQPRAILFTLGLPQSLGIIRYVRDCLPAAILVTLAPVGSSLYRQAVMAMGADALLTTDTLQSELIPLLQRLAQERFGITVRRVNGENPDSTGW
jgi:DNA-binding NarL/FixJ family response regulator